MTVRQIGFFQIILSGALFGFLGIFGKKAFQNNILPGELLGLRFFIAAIFIFLVLLVLRKNPLHLGKKKIITSFVLGAFGYAVFSSCYFYALKGISASLTVLLLYMYPVLVALGAQIFFKEKIKLTGWLALGISTIGLIFLVWGEWSISKPSYLIFGFCSALFYSIYILVSRKTLSNVDPMQSSMFVQLGAGTSLLLVHFSDVTRPLEIISNHGSLIILMAIICSVFPLTLFLAGLQKISSSEASILSTTEPIFGVIVATIFLGEKLLPIQILGGVFVLMGLILTSLRKN